MTLSPAVAAYLTAHNPPQPAILARLREETRTATDRIGMQISWEQAAFMQLMVRLMSARRYLEIGTFTGFSALAMALALPPDGRIVACDVSEAWTAIARRYWAEAGVADRIDLRLAPAVDTLDALLSRGVEPFDICFIDADKASYDAYYERALKLVRPGGLILLDNMLWQGKVADSMVDDADTRAIRALNAKIARDNRVTAAFASIGDGLQMAVPL